MDKENDKRMKILSLGNNITYRLQRLGMVPAHWTYGVSVFEEKGHTVANRDAINGPIPAPLTDLLHHIRQRPDIIFLPFISFKRHLPLILLRAIGVIRVPVTGFIHRTPRRRLLSMLLLHGIDHAFFLSPLTMKEVTEGGIMDGRRCSDAMWGPDLKFYEPYRKAKRNNRFVSTGKEHRDYRLMLEVFATANRDQLRILTCHHHAGSNYGYLREESPANVSVDISDNSGLHYIRYLREMSEAKCLVCPLIKERVNYCVGLSTIADAMGLGMPVITTHNPYHSFDVESEGIGIKAGDHDEWVRAIAAMNGQMAERAGEKALRLARERYNIENCGNIILERMESLTRGKKRERK